MAPPLDSEPKPDCSVNQQRRARVNFSLFSRRSVHPNPANSGTINRRAADHEDIAMTSFAFRRDIITKPIFSWARTVLPVMSDTEREALEAGDVW